LEGSLPEKFEVKKACRFFCNFEVEQIVKYSSIQFDVNATSAKKMTNFLGWEITPESLQNLTDRQNQCSRKPSKRLNSETDYKLSDGT